MTGTRVRTFHLLFLVALLLAAPFAFAQQTGGIRGRVTTPDGQELPGVTVEARSNALPQPRTTVTEMNGEYRLPALQPGAYTVTFTLSGMQTVTRRAEVLLGQETPIDVKLGVAAMSENITVTAETTLVNTESSELQSGLNTQQIEQLPIAQDYKDLQKLIPGVMVTNDAVRGPSAGASGQDNVYLFDGVNVTMPLFGVLTTEPATHDIAQVNITRGGARAIDFDRAGGFVIDSVSKSGTNKFSGSLQFQTLRHAWTASQAGTNSTYDEDRDYTTFNIGGPIISDRLYFYTSYYRPTKNRINQANFYGDLPEFQSTRNEYFGKLTYTPLSSVLLNASYRDSKRRDTSGDAFGTNRAGTTGAGTDTQLRIGTFDASWVVNNRSYATAKYTNFRNPGFGLPDNVAGVTPSLTPGSHLDIANLDRLGQFTVPTPVLTNPTQSAFVQPFIDRYGYLSNGVRTGGGVVGFNQNLHNDDDFSRRSGQVGYNITLGQNITHDLHIGYQRYTDAEDFFRTSNGFGIITIPGGTVNCPAAACGTAKPAFFQASFQNTVAGQTPNLHSEFKSQSIELNDAIHLNNWTFNVGVMASNDTLYGSGLTPADNIAGFKGAPGHKYKMHDVPFEDQIQPRLGATWAYNGSDTVYGSYARYNMAANSDARAASWDRNLVTTINAYYDREGNLLGVDPEASSSGKLFQEGIKPPHADEFILGTAQQLTSAWSARVYGRYRKAQDFWEDTNNNARSRFGAGVPGLNQADYIPNLTQLRNAIGSGSTYVIANLDGAFTKYYEGTLETDWHHNNTFLRGSYTLSHYYGNFDQDNSSFNTANDTSIFIGSSNIADGAGRQIWNNKYGDLRGDRRNVFKVYGTQVLPWNASAGAFFLYQSGQPYQLESFLPYRTLTTSTSDTNRYAEPAGRRKSPAHNQLDLNYTQNFALPHSLNLQLLLDVFNVYDKQTGYDYETRVGTLGPCTATTASCIDTEIAAQPRIRAPFAKSFYAPRRFQLAARIQF
jgi:hypothetical protein